MAVDHLSYRLLSKARKTLVNSMQILRDDFGTGDTRLSTDLTAATDQEAARIRTAAIGVGLQVICPFFREGI